MKPGLVSIAKKIGYFVAALIIMAALLVTASRALTPYLDARRGDIEQWASELLQFPIKIDNARVSWFQYQPGVALHNVSLLDAKTLEPALQIRTIKVFFSIPKSIWQRKLVLSGVLVEGTDIVVHQNAAGEFAVQGFPALGGYENEPFKNESKIRDVLGWLSEQPLMILRDIDIRYTGASGQKRLFTLYNLRLQNDDKQHSVSGKAILHQEISTEVMVAASFEGNEPDLNKITGKVYINVSGMSLAQWLKGRVWHGYEIKNGIVATKIWAFWREGEFQRIQSRFELLDIDMTASNKTSQHINRLSGEVGWKKEGKYQIIAGDDLLIDWASSLWPATSFYLKLAPDQNQQLVPVTMNVGYVDIEDARRLLVSAPDLMPANILKMAADLQLKGHLESVSAALAGDSGHLVPVMLQGRFSGLSCKALPRMPAMKNLTGNFVFNGDHGSIGLSSRDFELRYDAVFDKPLVLSELSGEILWQHKENDVWALDLQAVHALNADLALTLTGKLTLPATLKPQVDLQGNFSLRNAMYVTRYLPMKIFSADLNKWLRPAIKSGSVDSGSIIVRGNLTDFPFDKNNGDFIISGSVNNVQLHYAPDWPDLTNINGQIKFSGREILVDVERANIMEMKLGRTRAVIPYVGDKAPSILTVTADPIRTDFIKAMSFVHRSPLEKTLGKMFHNIALMGPITVTLGLTVPLEDTDSIKVRGDIDISNSELNLVPWKLSIKKLNGKINFTEDKVKALGVKGDLFGKPLMLNIDSIAANNKPAFVQATIINEIDLHDIETWLKLPVTETASGSTALNTTIDLSFDKPIDIHLQTSLVGISLKLPDQYGKTAEQKRMMKADITVSEGQPLKVKFNYADLLSAAMLLEQNREHFAMLGADIRIGGGDAAWPQGKGLYVTGHLPTLNEAKISEYLSMSDKSAGSTMPVKKIDVGIKDLDLYGIKLTDTRLQVEPAKHNWNISIESREVAGDISVPMKLTPSATIVADLDHINLDAISNNKSNGVEVVAKSLPNIKFSADSMIYDGSHIGSVNIVTAPSANGLLIKSLKVRSPELNLQASGDWTQTEKSNTTNLNGNASSKSVSALLGTLGFNVKNFVSSKGSLDFDLTWDAAPYALSLQAMSGEASLDMGQGRIVDIGDSTNAKMDLGRMLNLFSLQSLPRRLSFDFSDMFSKGYSFDSLKADFKFNHGDASTSNLRFDGPVARLEVHGRIGLDKKDFDLILSVTPYVTSSIPVAATLLTGQPVIGIAAWAVNKVIGGEVSKVVTYYYSISGSWTNPTWNVIEKSRADHA